LSPYFSANQRVAFVFGAFAGQGNLICRSKTWTNEREPRSFEETSESSYAFDAISSFTSTLNKSKKTGREEGSVL